MIVVNVGLCLRKIYTVVIVVWQFEFRDSIHIYKDRRSQQNSSPPSSALVEEWVQGYNGICIHL